MRGVGNATSDEHSTEQYWENSSSLALGLGPGPPPRFLMMHELYYHHNSSQHQFMGWDALVWCVAAVEWMLTPA